LNGSAKKNRENTTRAGAENRSSRGSERPIYLSRSLDTRANEIPRSSGLQGRPDKPTGETNPGWSRTPKKQSKNKKTKIKSHPSHQKLLRRRQWGELPQHRGEKGAIRRYKYARCASSEWGRKVWEGGVQSKRPEEGSVRTRFSERQREGRHLASSWTM